MRIKRNIYNQQNEISSLDQSTIRINEFQLCKKGDIQEDKIDIEIGLIAKSSRLKDPVNLAIWQTAQEIFNDGFENN